VSHIKCCVLTNISAVTIFKVNMWWGKFLKPYIVQAVGGSLDFMVLADGVVCYPMGGKHVGKLFLRTCGEETM
jgi:hypothetical protein